MQQHVFVITSKADSRLPSNPPWLTVFQILILYKVIDNDRDKGKSEAKSGISVADG